MRTNLRAIISALAFGQLALLLLTGCLEQVQSPRLPEGALNNFLLHLHEGAIEDARAYFAPGLVERTEELDASLQEASERLQPYQMEVDRRRAAIDELGEGQIQVTLKGRVRLRPPDDTSNEGWRETDIITARMVDRGPGWRLLDFELKCCEGQLNDS